MSRKDDLLDVLEGDYRAKSAKVADEWSPQIRAAEAALKQSRELVKKLVFDAVGKAMKQFSGDVSKRLDIGWDDERSSADITLPAKDTPLVRNAIKGLEKFKTQRDAARAKLDIRYAEVRRALLLHGATPEIVEMLDAYARE